MRLRSWVSHPHFLSSLIYILVVLSFISLVVWRVHDVSKKKRLGNCVTAAMASVRSAKERILLKNLAPSVCCCEGELTSDFGYDVFNLNSTYPIVALSIPKGVEGYETIHRPAGPLSCVMSKEGLIIFSLGPDCKRDLPLSLDQSVPFKLYSQEILQLTYDPTNGTQSAGDIWELCIERSNLIRRSVAD